MVTEDYGAFALHAWRQLRASRLGDEVRVNGLRTHTPPMHPLVREGKGHNVEHLQTITSGNSASTGLSRKVLKVTTVQQKRLY